MTGSAVLRRDRCSDLPPEPRTPTGRQCGVETLHGRERPALGLPLAPLDAVTDLVIAAIVAHLLGTPVLRDDVRIVAAANQLCDDAVMSKGRFSGIVPLYCRLDDNDQII